MSSADFAREIERASRRMVELRRAARNDASASWVEAALAELPRASARWFADSDHDLHVEQPSAVAEELAAVAKRCEPRGQSPRC